MYHAVSIAYIVENYKLRAGAIVCRVDMATDRYSEPIRGCA